MRPIFIPPSVLGVSEGDETVNLTQPILNLCHASVTYCNSYGNERPYFLKQTCSFKLRTCLSTHDLLLPPGIKELKRFPLFCNFYTPHCF